MIKYTILLTAIIFGTAACKNTPATTNTPIAEASTGNEAKNELVTLTAEQIKTIGIVIGEIPQRELSSAAKANGVVSVLNQNKALATSQFGGTVKTINVHSGDMVKAGDVIAIITNPYFIAVQEEYLMVQAQLGAGNPDAVASVANPQYAAIQEQFNTLQPQIALAEMELKRQKELNTGNAGSLKNLQEAESTLATLKARRTTTQAQMEVFSKTADITLRTKRAALEQKLRLMGIQPGGLSPESMQSTLAVRSPISGRIGEIMTKIGAYILENNAIAEIIDLNNLHLDLQVYEPDIARFHEKQIIQFSSVNNPGKTYTAAVHTIGAALDPVSKTLEIHAHIEGDKTGLVEGVSVVATVRTGKAKVAAVPDAALVRQGGNYYIFVQQAVNGTEIVFEKVPVRTGATEQGYTEIIPLTPLSEPARIAMSQAFFILGKLTNTGEE